MTRCLDLQNKRLAGSLRRAGKSAGILLAGAFLFGCAKEQAAPTTRPPTPVNIGKVSQKTMPVQLTAVGNVESITTVQIRAQVAGVVQEVSFNEGDFVHKGQVLLTIDPRPYQVVLDQATATLARDKATAVNNRAQADRYLKLLADGVVPASEVDTYTSAADSSDAVLKSDQAAIEAAKLNLEYCTITSPIDGRTGSIMVKAGNLVKVADVPIVVINQVNPIYVNFTVPQQYWSPVKEDMARGTLRVKATIPQDPGGPIEGKLTFVDNIVDVTTGTIHLRGTFDNPQNRLWPGLFVSTLLTLAEDPNATVVPAPAVVTTQQGSYVYVVKANNTVEQRTIVPGRTVETDTVINKGVQPGETVVIDGQVNLVPGAKIEIKNGNAAPGAVAVDAPAQGQQPATKE
jgi:multidrug efflux system membrane fusion protein